MFELLPYLPCALYSRHNFTPTSASDAMFSTLSVGLSVCLSVGLIRKVMGRWTLIKVLEKASLETRNNRYDFGSVRPMCMCVCLCVCGLAILINCEQFLLRLTSSPLVKVLDSLWNKYFKIVFKILFDNFNFMFDSWNIRPALLAANRFTPRPSGRIIPVTKIRYIAVKEV